MIKQSKDAAPGCLVIDREGRISVLKERKETDDGWWCAEGGGFADFVLNSDRYVILDRKSLMAVYQLTSVTLVDFL